MTSGFTLIELMIALAIMATIMSIAVPYYFRAVETAKVSVAIREIEDLQDQIDLFEQTRGRLPADLFELDGVPMDPWGNPYQYLPFDTGGGGKGGPPSKVRKDKFLHPLNTSYDLYSMGKDGRSFAPLTAKDSRDDIIRANDGEFIGLAARY